LNFEAKCAQNGKKSFKTILQTSKLSSFFLSLDPGEMFHAFYGFTLKAHRVTSTT
jgi:hypothetical protein